MINSTIKITDDELFNNYLKVYKLKEELSYNPDIKIISLDNDIFISNRDT